MTRALALPLAVCALFAAAEAAATPAQCIKALAPLAEGSVPDAAGFASVDCPADLPAPAFRHDGMTGFVRASRALAPDEIVPAYPNFGADMVLPGQMLHLVIMAGAVRIERDMEAMQAAKPGQRLFVKSADGQVLSVTYGSGAP